MGLVMPPGKTKYLMVPNYEEIRAALAGQRVRQLRLRGRQVHMRGRQVRFSLPRPPLLVPLLVLSPAPCWSSLLQGARAPAAPDGSRTLHISLPESTVLYVNGMSASNQGGLTFSTGANIFSDQDGPALSNGAIYDMRTLSRGVLSGFRTPVTSVDDIGLMRVSLVDVPYSEYPRDLKMLLDKRAVTKHKYGFRGDSLTSKHARLGNFLAGVAIAMPEAARHTSGGWRELRSSLVRDTREMMDEFDLHNCSYTILLAPFAIAPMRVFELTTEDTLVECHRPVFGAMPASWQSMLEVCEQLFTSGYYQLRGELDSLRGNGTYDIEGGPRVFPTTGVVWLVFFLHVPEGSSCRTRVCAFEGLQVEINNALAANASPMVAITFRNDLYSDALDGPSRNQIDQKWEGDSVAKLLCDLGLAETELLEHRLLLILAWVAQLLGPFTVYGVGRLAHLLPETTEAIKRDKRAFVDAELLRSQAFWDHSIFATGMVEVQILINVAMSDLFMMYERGWLYALGPDDALYAREQPFQFTENTQFVFAHKDLNATWLFNGAVPAPED